jgi:hypothetical protein
VWLENACGGLAFAGNYPVIAGKCLEIARHELAGEGDWLALVSVWIAIAGVWPE